MPRKVGPGNVTLNGDQEIDEVVANTNLIVIDGQLSVGIMRDTVTLKTQQSTATVPLNIKVKQILGTGSIDSAGKVFIDGPFNERVTINAVGDIQTNSIGDASELTSANGGIRAKSTADCCALTAAGNIQTGDVGSSSRFTSNTGGVDADCLGNNCTVLADGKVNVKGSSGVGCVLVSNSQSIFVGCNVGAGSALQARTSVVCRGGIDSNTSVASQADEIKVWGKVDDRVSLNAFKKLSVGCGVGVESTLESINDGIEIHGRIGAQSVSRAFKDIEISGTIEQGVRVSSTNGGINVDGIVGSESILEGVGLIKVKGAVLDKAILTCANGKIDITGRVSDSAILTANQVYINGVLQTLDAVNANTNPAPVVREIPRTTPRTLPTFWSGRNQQHSPVVESQHDHQASPRH